MESIYRGRSPALVGGPRVNGRLWRKARVMSSASGATSTEFHWVGDRGDRSESVSLAIWAIIHGIFGWFYAITSR